MKTFKEAFEADLTKAQLDRKTLADRLGISVQAIGKWVSKGEVPADRREQVALLLGAHAQVLTRTFDAELIADEIPPPVTQRFRSPVAMPRLQVPAVRMQLASKLGPKARYVEQVINFGASSRMYDYIGPRVAVKILPVLDNDSSGIARLGPAFGRQHLLSMALLKAVLTSDTPRVFALVLLNKGARLHSLDLARLASEASTLGIATFETDSVDRVAEYITDMEASLSEATSQWPDDLPGEEPDE